MIMQGGNTPITVTFDERPKDVTVTLYNEIQILKQWIMPELYFDSTGTICTANYAQEESSEWEEGPCEIEIRWTDSSGTVHTKITRDLICYSADKTILSSI